MSFPEKVHLEPLKKSAPYQGGTFRCATENKTLTLYYFLQIPIFIFARQAFMTSYFCLCFPIQARRENQAGERYRISWTEQLLAMKSKAAYRYR